MSAPDNPHWYATNQRHLMETLERIRAALERHQHGRPRPMEPQESEEEDPRESALFQIGDLFGLSSFERDILVMCAGIELQADFAALCGAAQGDASRTFPTFGLALAALPNPHWSALSPGGPLRYWRVIEIKEGPGLAQNPLRIDERILHFLTGVDCSDERLQSVVEPAVVRGDLAPSQTGVARELAATWRTAAEDEPRPPLQLCGESLVDKRAIALAACEMLKLRMGVMRANSIPVAIAELETMLRLWDREAALTGSALMLDCDDVESGDQGRENAIQYVVEHARSLLIVATRQRRHTRHRSVVSFDVSKPSTIEQRAIWSQNLRDARLHANKLIDALASQFDLNAPAIRSTCAAANAHLQSRGRRKRAAGEVETAVWDACRMQARAQLDDLAQRIQTTAAWDDLILADAQKSTLREIGTHLKYRAQVYDSWGFRKRNARGLGVTALFAGSSGTGKTMAAEVLANDLRLDLYVIDLSSVVSKYIGETEKNLRRVFDAAEEGGVVLLFDEADALFGKRTEVKDSHDRYANIEVSYLLQRMEAYKGLAILTTNFLEALDPAFVRRISFIIQFPFPSPSERAQIWQRAFPGDTPLEGLDAHKLALLNVAGGSIRNIALNAAFLAAEDDQPVKMRHLLQAARSEYAKSSKPLMESEIEGWI